MKKVRDSSGGGPFSIMIAKLARPKTIHAIDLKPEAVKYLEENMRLNKVENITPICGDALLEIEKLPEADTLIGKNF